MAIIIAISNQKGGVGKTTSAISLGYELAELGRKVLIIDFDPQGNATSGLGVELAEEGRDLFDMFFNRISLSAIISPTRIERLSVAPSTRDLVGLETELGKAAGRELILKTQVKQVQSMYDYVLIDCPPSLGILTMNALGAADTVLVPLQSEYYALEGVSALMNTIEFVRQTFNPELEIVGVFLTMFDSRTNLSSQVLDEANKYFGSLMFNAVVPRNVRLSEAPSHGLPIGLYDPSSVGARAYRNIAEELDSRCFSSQEEGQNPDGKSGLAANG